MTRIKLMAPLSAALLLMACNSNSPETQQEPPPTSTSNPTATGSADNRKDMSEKSSDTLVKEGRIEAGTECPVLHTPDGEIWALALGGADFGPGDYVRVTGKRAEAGFCQQGKGTIEPSRIDPTDPPARDRDPARAGGIAVTTEYVQGNWVAKGVDADCAKPDFAVRKNLNGMSLIETRVNGVPETGVVDVGSTPALHWDEPLPALPIETRGPDGLAVMPAKAGKTVTIAGHRIVGDGVVFLKCG